MSNSKSYNSIVFLTTLYLGLVFVGATPQMLTFAALTRNFDVQNEIEVRDDLDNKPDNEEIENFAKNVPNLFAQLLKEIKEEVKSGKIMLSLHTDFYVDEVFTKSRNCGGGISSIISNENLNLLIQNEIDQNFHSQALELTDCNNEKSKKVKVRIEANDTYLSLRISFDKSKAEQFAEFLNQEFSSSGALAENALSKQIYENTKITSENNQVFIVTRLPRGSLDALLANKDAQ